MDNKNLVAAGFAVLAVVFGVSYLKPTSVLNQVNVPEQRITLEGGDNLGAFPGPDIQSDLNIRGSLTYCGGKANSTSTTATSYTVVEKDLRNYCTVDLMVNTGNTTFTLPASSTMMSLLPTVGATREWLFHNATSSTITLTLAAGAGTDLVAVTANDDVIDAGEWTRLTCQQITYRSADNENIVCIVDELANAD